MPAERVAFIDDEAFWRQNVEETLELEGYKIETFERAEPVISNPEYNIIISDGQLSDNKDGIDYLIQIHSNGFCGKLLLYTNLPRFKDFELAKQHGVTIVRKSEVLSDVLQNLQHYNPA